MSLPTLDDVALRVLQLEPEDQEALAYVHEQLTWLAAADRVVPAAQPLVAAAVRALAPILRGTVDDPANALGRVGRLMQSAVLAAEGGVRRRRARRSRTT
ncbi:MAG: hypothetical protein M3154_11725 [Candidatus Eremiobacteraeota bacterium]|nr:hypothetical protein [Candidatus Eremiobacteraeota bacterium]